MKSNGVWRFCLLFATSLVANTAICAAGPSSSPSEDDPPSNQYAYQLRLQLEMLSSPERMREILDLNEKYDGTYAQMLRTLIWASEPNASVRLKCLKGLVECIPRSDADALWETLNRLTEDQEDEIRIVRQKEFRRALEQRDADAIPKLPIPPLLENSVAGGKIGNTCMDRLLEIGNNTPIYLHPVFSPDRNKRALVYDGFAVLPYPEGGDLASRNLLSLLLLCEKDPYLRENRLIPRLEMTMGAGESSRIWQDSLLPLFKSLKQEQMKVRVQEIRNMRFVMRTQSEMQEQAKESLQQLRIGTRKPAEGKSDQGRRGESH